MPADPKQTHIAAQWKYNSPLIACRFDPSGRFVFTSAEDTTIQRWDLSNGSHVVYPGHESWVRALAFLPKEKLLVSGGSDDRLLFWPIEAEKPAPVRTIEAHRGWIRTISVSPDGTLIASGGNDNLVKLWNPADGQLVRQLEGHTSNVYSTLFHPNGQFLLSGDLNGEIRQWEIATGKLVRTLDAKALHTYNGGQQVHYGGVRSLALSPDGKHLAACGLHKASNPLGAVNEPLNLLFDWESGKLLRSQVTSNSLKGIAWRVVFLSPDTLVVASGGSGGGALIFWKTDQDKEFHQFKLPNTARDMDVHPDGLRVATIHYDRQVRISLMAPKKQG